MLCIASIVCACIWCIIINANSVHYVAFCEHKRKLSEIGVSEREKKERKKLKKRRVAHTYRLLCGRHTNHTLHQFMKFHISQAKIGENGIKPTAIT